MEQEILKKLKKLRKDNNVKPIDIANFLNIDLSAYNRLENGENNTWGKYFVQLLEFYKLSPSEFFQDIEGKNFIHQQNTDFKDNSIGLKQIDTYNADNRELYSKLEREKEERIKEKDKIIQDEREQKESWKAKYYRCKESRNGLEEENKILKAKLDKLNGK